MDLGLKDRVYVVTGATRGLGRASAEALLAEGAKVLVTGREEKTVAEAVAELGPGAAGVAADNDDPETPARLIAEARARFGGFDGILISVGGPAPGFAADNTDEQWAAAFGTVFLGAVRLARAAAETLTDGGVIGFVLSGSVHEPIPGLTIPTGCAPVSPASRSPSPTTWARAGYGSSGCCRAGSTPTGCGPSTHSPATRTRPARPTRPRSRCAATAPRRSSGGRRPSCCRRPPRT